MRGQSERMCKDTDAVSAMVERFGSGAGPDE